jgi:nucleolar protein 56
MKILYTTWFGVFVIEDSNVIDKVLFKRNINYIYKKSKEVIENQVLEEEKILADKHPSICVPVKRLYNLGKIENIKSINLKPESYGFSLDLKRELIFKLGEEALNKSDQDTNLREAVRIYDAMQEYYNNLNELYDQWKRFIYGYNTENENIDTGQLMVLKNMIYSYSNELKKWEEFIKAEAERISPNASAILGGILAARFIEHAGGLKKISMKSASSIQIMGAEKAFYKAKKRMNGKMPKHGLLFMHPYVHTSQLNKRGKIARIIACKTAIAFRVDASSGKFIGDELNKYIDQKVKSILKGAN